MNKRAYLGFVSMLILLSCSLGLGADLVRSNRPAALRVTILDDNGSLFHSAHIYIFSSDKKEFFGTREASGMTNFDLPPGDYRIYAGMTLKANGIVDHYASPEANVRISMEEPTSVILTLQRAEDGEMSLSDSARQKLDIGPELAKNLN